MAAMLNTVDRYLCREVIRMFAAILVVLLAIFLTVIFLRALEEMNVTALGMKAVLRYLYLQAMRDLPGLLPPAFFIAMLATLARLARDSELIALNACGVGLPRIYRTLLLLALPMALLTGWLSLAMYPKAAAGIQELRLQQREQATQIAGLQAGRFYEEARGDMVVYIGGMDRRRSLSDVFILDRRGEETMLVFSHGGAHRLEEASGDHLVTLRNGYRFDGQAGEGQYLVGQFGTYQLRMPGKGPQAPSLSKRAARPTAHLVGSADLADRVELEHRIAAPLAVLALTLLAIPLIEISPRRSSTGRMLLALLAYFAFFNLQRLAESWLDAGVTPLWLGSLWYQPVVLALVYLILTPESFWWRRLRWRLSGSRTRSTATDKPSVD